jgi:hypothetical protein
VLKTVRERISAEFISGMTNMLSRDRSGQLVLLFSDLRHNVRSGAGA